MSMKLISLLAYKQVYQTEF